MSESKTLNKLHLTVQAILAISLIFLAGYWIHFAQGTGWLLVILTAVVGIGLLAKPLFTVLKTNPTGHGKSSAGRWCLIIIPNSPCFKQR